MNTIPLKIFQLTPSSQLLGLPAEPVLSALCDHKSLEDVLKINGVNLKESKTIKDVLACFKAGDKDSNRTMTIVMNTVLASLGESSGWDSAQKGIAVSKPELVKKGKYRSIFKSRYATLRADRVEDGSVYFNVQVSNRVLFDKNLPVAEVFNNLVAISGKETFLPAIDRKRLSGCVIKSFSNKPFFFGIDSKKGDEAEKWGEFFVRNKRISEEEHNAMEAFYHEGKKDLYEIKIAHCSYWQKSKIYHYPARDMELIASTALQGFVKNQGAKITEPALAEAGELCEEAFTSIREGMKDKCQVFSGLEHLIGQWFDLPPAVEADYIPFEYESERKVRRKDKYGLKTKEMNAEDLKAINAKNVILYPVFEGHEERKKIFLGFFNGGQAKDLGFQFDVLDYYEQIAVKDPMSIVERVIEAVGENANVVIAWRKWSNGNLVNNKLIEFEFMRHGIAVQHVIDEGQKGNANKVGNILQGMKEKFGIHPDKKSDLEIPFDITLGLDVSRFDGQDVPAFPVLLDRHGHPSLHMLETYDHKAKEQRTIDELVDTLNSMTQGKPTKVLFLRDGYAFEDYETVAAAVPHVELTVLSIRKNLLGAFSEEMPVGDFYGLYAEHSKDRFIFGVNARMGQETRINTMHMVEIIRNPGAYSNKEFGEILLSLSQQNLTCEFQVASLPFPVAYADRCAWDIRDKMQDKQLKKYVREQYPDDVNSTGEGREDVLIYKTIRQFVTLRKNGYAFAV